MEGYKTISEISSAETEVKHSRFIATVCPCKTEREATEFVASMRKKYWDARHNVYAFSIRENSTKRFSDDGEPHSTAGLPVMEVINHSGITDIAVVVTRYFGGILLGTGGLVRAYQAAVKAGLEAATVVEKCEGVKLTLGTDYNGIGKIQYIIGNAGVHTLDTRYAENVEVDVVVPLEDEKSFVDKITEATAARTQIDNLGNVQYIIIDGKCQVT